MDNIAPRYQGDNRHWGRLGFIHYLVARLNSFYGGIRQPLIVEFDPVSCEYLFGGAVAQVEQIGGLNKWGGTCFME